MGGRVWLHKKVSQKNFVHLSLLLLFLDPRSGIRDKHPGSATLFPIAYFSVLWFRSDHIIFLPDPHPAGLADSDHGWRKRKGSDIEGRGPTYDARSLPQYISAFATRVLLSTYVCVKGEKAWGRIFKLFRTPAIDSMEAIHSLLDGKIMNIVSKWLTGLTSLQE